MRARFNANGKECPRIEFDLGSQILKSKFIKTTVPDHRAVRQIVAIVRDLVPSASIVARARQLAQAVAKLFSRV